MNDTNKFVTWFYDKTVDTNQVNEIRCKLLAEKKIIISKIYKQQKMYLFNTLEENSVRY